MEPFGTTSPDAPGLCKLTRPYYAAGTQEKHVFIHAVKGSGTNIQAEQMSSSAELWGVTVRRSAGLYASRDGSVKGQVGVCLSLESIIYP